MKHGDCNDADVVRALALARRATGDASGGGDPEHHQVLPAVLIMVRTPGQGMDYEFVYSCAAEGEGHAHLEELYNKTPVLSRASIDSSVKETKGGMIPVSINEKAAAVRTSLWEFVGKASVAEPLYVGKAMFTVNAVSLEETKGGKVCLDPFSMAEGSEGWKEAMKQKYHQLEAESRTWQDPTEGMANQKSAENLKVAGKAVAAAATGSAMTTSLTSFVASAMGYTSAGIATNSAAASIMSAQAVASGGGVAAGSFTAVMQSIGTVGVLARPVGMSVAATGAFVGLATGYVLHRRNQFQCLTKEQEGKEQEGKQDLDQSGTGKISTVDKSASDAPSKQLTQDDKSIEPPLPDWTVVYATRKAKENHAEYGFITAVQREAEQIYTDISSTATAKILMNPEGKVIQVDVNSNEDRDGWKMALELHYAYLLLQGTIPVMAAEAAAGNSGSSTSVCTPLSAQ
jgi:Interferon-induced 6-16 family